MKSQYRLILVSDEKIEKGDYFYNSIDECVYGPAEGHELRDVDFKVICPDYLKSLNNIVSELQRQTELILSPKANQANALLQVLVQCLNSNKVKVAEYNARINTYLKYHNLEDFVNESEVIKEYFFTTLCIDNIVRENELLQNQIDKLLI